MLRNRAVVLLAALAVLLVGCSRQPQGTESGGSTSTDASSAPRQRRRARFARSAEGALDRIADHSARSLRRADHACQGCERRAGRRDGLGCQRRRQAPTRFICAPMRAGPTATASSRRTSLPGCAGWSTLPRPRNTRRSSRQSPMPPTSSRATKPPDALGVSAPDDATVVIQLNAPAPYRAWAAFASEHLPRASPDAGRACRAVLASPASWCRTAPSC